MSNLKLTYDERNFYRDKMLAQLRDGLPLKENIKLCGSPRPNSDNKYKCRKVGCPRCRSSYIGREGKAAIKRYADARSEEMGMLTINLGVAASPEQAFQGWNAHRKRLRYIVAAQPRRAWSYLGMTAYFEAFPFAWDEVPLLGSEQQEYIASVGLPSAEGTRSPYWLYHVHALVNHPSLDWQQVREVIRENYPAPHQVHFSPMYECNTKNDNISRIISYSNKYQPVDELKGTRRDWCSVWSAEYFYQCERFSNWHKSLRMVINPRDRPITISELLEIKSNLV